MKEFASIFVRLSALFLLLGGFVIGLQPALAQTPVADCGLPAEGVIFSSVTYTLTADCEQTGQITVANAPLGQPQFVVTINGGGHRISGGEFRFLRGPSAIFNFNDVTFDGGGMNRSYMINGGTVNANRVTFTGTNGGVALLVDESRLNNTLFSWNTAWAFALGGNASAAHLSPNSSHT